MKVFVSDIKYSEKELFLLKPVLKRLFEKTLYVHALFSFRYENVKPSYIKSISLI